MSKEVFDASPSNTFSPVNYRLSRALFSIANTIENSKGRKKRNHIYWRDNLVRGIIIY